MSLIEQAAKRLEELRRAGVESPDSVIIPDTHRATPLPTPEAAVHALEKRMGPAIAAPNVPPDGHEMLDRVRQSSSPDMKARDARSDINLARLRSLGFVTPDMPRSQIADEFRVVKRPIIHNALANAGG